MKKKALGIFTAMAIIISFCIPVSATNDNIYEFVIDGNTYVISKSYQENTQVVTTTMFSADGNKFSTTTTLDEDTLTVYYDNGYSVSTSLAELSTTTNKAPTPYTNSDTLETREWDYYYFYSDIGYEDYGMFFSLRIGTQGSWSGHDEGNMEARSLAYDFCADVRALEAALVDAERAAGAAAAEIAAAILLNVIVPVAAGTVPPAAALAAIAGLVLSIAGTAEYTALWQVAYNKSRDCDQTYLQFKQSL